MPLTGQFTSIPSGTLVPHLSGNRLSAPFDMKAAFDNAGGSCAAGEYRQYVRGTFTADGVTVPHVLCGSVLLSPVDLREDGCPPPGCTAYGYRVCPDHPYNKYLPSRVTGCTYEGKDDPGISSAPGATIAMDLTFRGQLIDTSTSRVLASADWKVKGSATIPMNELTTYRFSGVVTGGKPLVHVVRSGDHWVVSLLYAGAPAGKAETLDIAVLDAAGKALPVQPAEGVVEVGGLNTTTRVLSLKVDVSSGLPARVRVKSGAEVVDLPIAE